MRETVLDHLKKVGLVPVVVMSDAKSAAPAARAMREGGVDVMEITLRTPAGLEALRYAADEGILAGAGTVLSSPSAGRRCGRGRALSFPPASVRMWWRSASPGVSRCCRDV